MRGLKRLRAWPRSERLGAEALERRQCLAVSVSVALAEPTVIEGESHVATIRLSQPLTQVERVLVSIADRTATYGRDYFGMLSEQVVFMPGQTSKTVTIKTLRDAAFEGVETFTITAEPVNPGIRSGSATARIGDYTPPPSIRVSDISVTEGNSGTTPGNFTITLSAAYLKPVTVSYATRDGSATVADADYQATNGTLTFAPGETSKTVGVKVVGDRKLEANETFELVLSAPTNATLARPTATATIVNDEIDQPGYQITLVFLSSPVGEVPQAIRDLAAEAAARWSRVIVGDLPGEDLGGIFVDDLQFNVQMGLLGGDPNAPGGVLADAAPVRFRAGENGLPYEAITGIDPADANFSTAAERALMLDLLVHEMGHGLGFTDNAAFFGRFVDAASSSFTGPNAVREYNSVFGVSASGVPLQPVVLAHWDETVFRNEVMTPQIAAAGNPLSRITVGALQDMGYTVNYAAADMYSRPLTVSSPPGGSPSPGVSPLPASQPPAPPVTPRPPSTPIPAPQTPSAPASPSWAIDPGTRRLPAAPWRVGAKSETPLIPAAVAVGPSLWHRTALLQAVATSSNQSRLSPALQAAALALETQNGPAAGDSRGLASSRLFAAVASR
jgi:hypothetical protein